ncbi:MAG: ABC-2 family transporter protein [Candidatus Eremiobacteraeota bacterium]|nr:ABC-2 family transporter protein [Candidatus Eremiobacteraeota bacterium]
MQWGAYVEFAKRAFSREATYREEVFTQIGSIALRVYLYYALWSALYANNGPKQDFSFTDIITYATLALLIGLIYNVQGPYVVREKIREGNISIDLMRPISVPLYVFADTIGQAGFALLQIVVALPIAIGLLALNGAHLSAPASPGIALAFVFSVALGFLVNFFLDLLMATITFWTMEIFGFQLIVQFITSLLAGAIVPLQFFPSAVTAIAQVSPFAAIYNAPLSIYLGKYQGPELVQTLGLQAIWVVVFGLGAMALWRVGERKVVVQGG